MEAIAAVPGHAAAAPGPVHDLKTLVLSRHPGIVIETAEPERADRLLSSVASDLRLLRSAGGDLGAGARRGRQGRLRQVHREDPAAFDMAALVQTSNGFSGAEIEQAVTAALLGALQRKQPLATESLLEELRSTVPLSVTRREDIAALRADAQGRFVPVR